MYSIRKLPNKNLYRVRIIATGQIVAKATKEPHKLIQAIELNKKKKLTGGNIIELEGERFNHVYNEMRNRFADDVQNVHPPVERFRNNPNMYVVTNRDNGNKFLVSLEGLPVQQRNIILGILSN